MGNIIDHYKDPVLKQPVYIMMESKRVLFVVQLVSHGQYVVYPKHSMHGIFTYIYHSMHGIFTYIYHSMYGICTNIYHKD